MDLQEVVEVRNCPACGHKNQPGLTECSYCGADISRVPLVKELRTMPAVQDAANRPPPPPPSPEQRRKAESAAKRAALFKTLKSYVLAVAGGVGAVALLYAVSSKEPGRAANAPVAAAAGPAALDVFYSYKLRGGDDKGKTMRQFWTEYAQMYELSRAPGKPGMDIKFLSQASASGNGLHEVFVFESVAGERRRAFAFSVAPASGEVAPARACDFGPDIPAEYSVASCESVQDLFPAGF